MKKEDLNETVQIPEEFLVRLNKIRDQYETIINGLNSKIDTMENNSGIEQHCLTIIEDILDFLFLIVNNQHSRKG